MKQGALSTLPATADGVMDIFPPEHVWIYVTDRCNLACRHCFYQNRTGRRVLSPAAISALFEMLKPGRPHSFVISGGEPLMAWPEVQEIVKRVAARGDGSTCSLQSNLLLLDRAKADYLQRHKVSLEVGIDGDAAATAAARPLLVRNSPEGYHDIVCRNIARWRSAGGRMTATMTVRPENVKDMVTNFEHLVALGLSVIEVHPALLQPWTAETARDFLRGYRVIWAQVLRWGTPGRVGTEYSRQSGGVWDVLVMPDGNVLPSWVWLAFPLRIRNSGRIMSVAGGKVCLLPAAEYYFRGLAEFLRRSRRGARHITYRGLSNFNALLAMGRMKDPGESGHLQVYLKLSRMMGEIDRRFGRSDNEQRSAAQCYR